MSFPPFLFVRGTASAVTVVARCVVHINVACFVVWVCLCIAGQTMGVFRGALEGEMLFDLFFRTLGCDAEPWCEDGGCAWLLDKPRGVHGGGSVAGGRRGELSMVVK